MVMRMFSYSLRTAREILRDPLNLGFGLGFPLVLLFLLSAIQANIPVSLFELDMLTPGLTVFGLAFMTLFSAALIAKDRSSSLLQRLYTTPLRPSDYILGYMLPVLPISAAQCLLCYLAAACLGLKLTINVLWALLLLIPAEIFFIALGLLCGSVLTDKQVGGICGALLTNLTAWLSGVWFDLDLVGGTFKAIAYALPFVHAVEMERAVLAGNYSNIWTHLLWVLGYGIVALVAAVLLFLRQMRRQ
ncbi:MAG: ABC transporter permease [Clostridiales bacterium]|nr:ABC transporter permease [Clostridiales bacterium]